MRGGKDIDLAHLEEQLFVLRGEPCFQLFPGGSGTTAIDLDFGRQLQRAEPLTNPALSLGQRSTFGEYSLFIQCAWRLDSERGPQCSWSDATDDISPVADQVVGASVDRIEFSRISADLRLVFTSGLSLSVFCDQPAKAEEADNYSFFTLGAIYTVGSGSWLRVQERARDDHDADGIRAISE